MVYFKKGVQKPIAQQLTFTLFRKLLCSLKEAEMPKAFGRLNGRLKGQSTLELTVALIAVFILLLGTVQVFVWLNERMVLRQEAYEATRVPEEIWTPGYYTEPDYYGYGGVWIPPEFEGWEPYEDVEESDFPPLDIFGPYED